MTPHRLRAAVCVVVCALTACRSARVARSEGTIDIGAGRHLAYVALGAGKDTVVVLHGGPGVDHDYLESPLTPRVVRSFSTTSAVAVTRPRLPIRWPSPPIRT